MFDPFWFSFQRFGTTLGLSEDGKDLLNLTVASLLPYSINGLLLLSIQDDLTSTSPTEVGFTEPPIDPGQFMF